MDGMTGSIAILPGGLAVPAGPPQQSLAPKDASHGLDRRVVVVDPAAQDHGSLLADLEPGATGHVLDPSRDGLQRPAELLAGDADLASVSVVAHGGAAWLALGSTILDRAGLPSRSIALWAIGRVLAPDGALLFGCEVGAGADGRAFPAAPRRRARPPAGGELRAGRLRAHPGRRPTPPTGVPLSISDFSTGGSGFVRGGGAVISGSVLQLTAAEDNKAGIAVYDQTFSSSLGLSFTFTYFSGGGTPPPDAADGINFFLLNGDTVASAASVTPGDLGHSNNGQNGITGGFLGIGFDTFGNYAQADKGQSSSGTAGSTKNYVGLRGQGSGATGCNWIDGVAYGPGSNGIRTIQVDLIRINNGSAQLQVSMRPLGSSVFTQVIDETINQTLPSKLYFGFAASTGGYNDRHEINDIAVRLPVNLAFGLVTVQNVTTGTTDPATLSPGDQFTYTLTNNGPNEDGQITVNDALPANILGAGWTVSDSDGNRSGTGGTIPVNLLSGATASITVSGQVHPDSTSDSANHVITADASPAYTFNDPNAAARTGVTLNIGPGGATVSLVRANPGGAAGDAAAVAPFPAASVVDTYVDPGTSDPIDAQTVAIAPAAGQPGAAGATHDASSGTLTASGTPAHLQAILRSLLFTPAANSAAPGTTTPVVLTVTATSSSPGNTSATQTATYAVTSLDDATAIGGAAANQPVDDDAILAPFAALTVTDPDQTGATASVTIGGGAANGSFTPGSSAGWTASTAGNGDTTYARTFAAQPDASATTTLTVIVTDTASSGAGVTDRGTSVVFQDATSPPPRPFPSWRRRATAAREATALPRWCGRPSPARRSRAAPSTCTRARHCSGPQRPTP